MGKFRPPEQKPGYRLFVATGASAAGPAKPQPATEFKRFKDLAAKLVHVPKPEADAKP